MGFHDDTTPCQFLDDFTEVVQVAPQPVKAMNVQGVSFTEVLQASIKLGAGCVLAAGLVLEDFIKGYAFKLSRGVLDEGADSKVADVLA